MAGYKNNHVLISISTPPVLQHPSPSGPIIWRGRCFNSFFTSSLDATDVKQALWAELSANGLVNGVALDRLGLEPHLWAFFWRLKGLGKSWVAWDQHGCLILGKALLTKTQKERQRLSIVFAPHQEILSPKKDVR